MHTVTTGRRGCLWLPSFVAFLALLLWFRLIPLVSLLSFCAGSLRSAAPRVHNRLRVRHTQSKVPRSAPRTCQVRPSARRTICFQTLGDVSGSAANYADQSPVIMYVAHKPQLRRRYQSFPYVVLRKYVQHTSEHSMYHTTRCNAAPAKQQLLLLNQVVFECRPGS